MNNTTQLLDATTNGRNGHDHSPMLDAILPIKELIRAGKELQSLDKVQEYARPLARAVRNTPYDASKNPDDRKREDDHQKDLAFLPDAEHAAAHALTNVRDGERRAAELQHGIQEPKLPTRIVVTAIAVIAVSLGPTLHDRFFHSLDDQFIAWVMAMGAAALIGALITWSVGGIHDTSGRRSTTNVAGLIGGFGVGVCGFLLRLAVGDFLIGLALTILEFAAVALVELYAAPLREKYRAFLAAKEAHHQATSVLETLHTEAARRSQQLEEVQQRLQNHKDYLAQRTYCVEKFPEVEEAAVQIATKAFLEREAEQQRQQEREQKLAKDRRLGLV